MLKFILTSFVLIATIASNAQNTGTIRGQVTDRQSQFPLYGVQIVVLGTEPLLGAVSDENGYFRIQNIPAGRVSVEVKFTGYAPMSFSNLLLNSGKDLELNVQIEESVNVLSGVEIIGNENKSETQNKMSTVSSRSFNIEDAMRYSGTLQDPARMAQNYAGVSNASDDRNDIIIRGNSPNGVLWRMEGIDIPSPNHFATVGTTGGPISILNINNLANSDFMTSAFSADYGNALAGVFDLRLRSGNPDKREFLGQIGFNGLEFGAEGPFKKGGSATYIVNARYSFLDIMGALGVNFGTGSAIPEYQDVTFKVDLPTKKAGKFSIFGMGGTSFINFKGEDADENSLYSSGRENQQFTSTTGVVGASHVYFFNEKTQGRAVVAVSSGGTEGYTDTLDINGNAYKFFGILQRQNKVSGHYSINSKRNARNTIKAGVMYDLFLFEMRDSILTDNGRFFLRNDFSGDAGLLQAYVLWQNRASDRWTINSGIHGQYFLLNDKYIVEPRIGARYAVKPGHSLNVGAGLHSQMQPIPIYFNREELDNGEIIANNRNLDFNKSAHAVVGYDIQLSEFWRMKSEVYYQYLFDIAVDRAPSTFSVLNTGADFTFPDNADLVNEGEGYNYGAEITLERFLNKGFYFLFTSSVFESKYRASDGSWRNTAFNGNYVFNLLAGKEFKVTENSVFTLDTKLTYAGGRMYTPINLEASIAAGQEVLDQQLAFESQFDPYARWDVKIGYRINHKKIAQVFAFDARNVTGRENVFLRSYNNRSRQVETTYQIGFFPVFLYSVYF